MVVNAVIVNGHDERDWSLWSFRYRLFLIELVEGPLRDIKERLRHACQLCSPLVGVSEAFTAVILDAHNGVRVAVDSGMEFVAIGECAILLLSDRFCLEKSYARCHPRPCTKS